MITIHFKHSRSKRLPFAKKSASCFLPTIDENGITIKASVKKIFEHWEDFNRLIWTIIDWNGTYVEFDSMKYHSHADISRIFFSLELSHLTWMNQVETILDSVFDRHTGTFVSPKPMTDEQANAFLDYLKIKTDSES